MTIGTVFKTSVCLFAAACAGAALADDGSRLQVERNVRQVGPEISVNGITVAEYYDQQATLNRWLISATPDGTRDAVIRADLSAEDVANIKNPPRANTPGPLRIGAVKTIRPLRVNGVKPGQADTTYEEFANGGFTWATTISSADADGIRIHLSNVSLPAGTEMYLFNTEGEARGPYTGTGRHGTGDFWTGTVFSDTVVLLVDHPGPATARDRASVRFVIDKVGHIRPNRPFAGPQATWSQNQCGNEACVLDANCGSVAPADQSAIAKMEWISGAFIFTCTGGLIADTDGGSQRNLFLSANHCLSRKKDANNVETFFVFTTSSCNGTCPSNPAPNTIGSTILSTSRNGDHTLFELSGNPPSGSTFLGWSNSPIANSSGADLFRVSNPNFGPQVFSHHQVDTATGTCNGLPRGEFIYSHDVEGATDGGSSGSPIVNSSGQIVGQLFGCCGFNCGDVCDSGSNATVDGALAFYFDDVAEFLDPQGGGGGCAGDAECDDGQFCNGVETCAGGACQSGSDPCPGQGCDEGTDQCVTCGGNKASCSASSDCCSNNCRNGSCRGN